MISALDVYTACQYVTINERKWNKNIMLTSSPLLNVVVTSIPFLSLLLYSVSSTVLTVLVEFPSTRPSDDTADFPWLGVVNFDAIRKRKRDFVFGGTTYKLTQNQKHDVSVLKNYAKFAES